MTRSLFPSRELREYADALDSDRGHGKSRVTALMREAADEIERLREIHLISYPMTPVDCLISELGRQLMEHVLALCDTGRAA